MRIAVNCTFNGHYCEVVFHTPSIEAHKMVVDSKMDNFIYNNLVEAVRKIQAEAINDRNNRR